MDPLVSLLLEMGSRAKQAEAANQQCIARIRELEEQVKALTPPTEDKKEN